MMIKFRRPVGGSMASPTPKEAPAVAPDNANAAEGKGPKSTLEAMMLAGVKTFPLLIGIILIAGGVGHHRVGALLVGSI
jgi:hypothetical protein